MSDMTLNLQTEYALRIIIYLLTRPEETVSNRQIAEKYGISLNHLSKVSQKLAQMDVISTTRGVGGGIRIKKAALAMKVGDLMQSIEPDTEMVACTGTKSIQPCPIIGVCTARGIIAGAQKAFWEHLNQYTVEDLVKGRHLNAIRKVFKD